MGNRRKEGRENSSVVYSSRSLAVITRARARRGVHYKENDSLAVLDEKHQIEFLYISQLGTRYFAPVRF